MISQDRQLNIEETIAWLQAIGRPPLPECPIEAAKQGKEPKAPCFFDGKRVISVSWKQWQTTQPIDEILATWFSHPKTGIGTLGGWNGKHWLGWVDFDQKDFASAGECDARVRTWEQRFNALSEAPCFRTPSGGYRFLVAFNREPENFKANSGFSLQPDGSHHCGELLTKNGGHTLLPPTLGVTGTRYKWVRFVEYPPVFDSPEDIGLYPVVKKQKALKPVPPQQTVQNSGDRQLADLLEREIYPRLTSDRIFTWHGHNFQEDRSGKLRGNCPWHESKSGTAFYAEQVEGQWVWRCPACELGGNVLTYRHLLAGGNGQPREKEFVDLVKELAEEVGVSMPMAPKVVSIAAANSAKESTAALFNQLSGRMNELIEQNLPESELTLELSRLAQQLGQPLSSIWSLHNALVHEKEQKDALSSSLPQFEVLLNNQIQSKEIDWETLFPTPLIKALSTKSEAARFELIFLIQSLLPAVGGLMGANTGIVCKEGETESDHWVEYPIIWTAVIAPPSAGKSTADRAIFNPIGKMQEAEAEKHERDKRELAAIEERWGRMSKDEKAELFDSDENPAVFRENMGSCRKFLLDEGEIEAIKRRIAEQPPNAGATWASDELLGIFRGLDQYKHGRGNGRQFLLKAWNSPLTGYIDRVNEAESFRFRGQILNLCGGIQVEPAGQFFNADGQNTDADGLQSRILPAVPALHDDFDVWSDVRVSLDSLLTDLYKKVQRLPKGLVFLTPQAQKRWQRQWEKYRRGVKTYLNKNPAYAYFLGKMCSNLMRIALVLHAIEHCYQPKFEFHTLELDTLEKAIKMADFYVGQFRLGQSLFTSSPDQGMSEFLMQVLNFCLSEGELAAYQVVDKWRRRPGKNGKPIRAAEVKEMFATIAQARPQLVTFDGKKLYSLQKHDRNLKNTIATRSPDRANKVIQNGHSSEKHDQYDRTLVEKSEIFDENLQEMRSCLIVKSTETPTMTEESDTIMRSCFDRVSEEAIVFSERSDGDIQAHKSERKTLESAPVRGATGARAVSTPDVAPEKNTIVFSEMRSCFSTDPSQWQPGDKFRYTGNYGGYQKYKKQELIFQLFNAERQSVSATGINDEFSVGSIERIQPDTQRLTYYSGKMRPKKGDRVISGSEKQGQITAVHQGLYEITWEDERKMGYDLKDLNDLDIRRIDG
jgi:hypothetical protein